MIIKQHDTNIRFEYTPTINGVALTEEQLQNCTVSFIIRTLDTKIAVKRAATIEALKFVYEPVAEDVANDGNFYQEWELLDASGKPLTFPNNGYYELRILPDLG
jgi:hypothetical protein